MQIDAIILDVDGTIWNSAGIVARGWNRAMRSVGDMRPDLTGPQLSKHFGKPMNEIADAIFEGDTPEQKAKLLKLCEEYEQEELEADPCDIAYEGVVETIRELSKNYHVYVVSNCQSGYIEMMMKKLGLEDSITDTECYGDTGFGKAENLQILIDRNQIQAPIYVGDTQMDLNACQIAGVPFVFASYGFGTIDERDAVGVLDSFSDLLDFVKYGEIEV